MIELRWVVRHETDSDGDKWMARVLQYRQMSNWSAGYDKDGQPYMFGAEWRDVPTERPCPVHEACSDNCGARAESTMTTTTKR